VFTCKTSNRKMKELEISIKIFEYKDSTELTAEYQVLVEKAKEVAKKAYAPYSKFNVGAAVLLENGTIVTGNNQENVAYPSGLCAERIAIFHANATYPDQPIKAIAISSMYKGKYNPNPVYPCGACRQVMFESQNRFNKPIDVIMHGSNGIKKVTNVKSLLPLSFDFDLKSED
jgi:cytidine deaminase, homotetrameric